MSNVFADSECLCGNTQPTLAPEAATVLTVVVMFPMLYYAISNHSHVPKRLLLNLCLEISF